MAVSVTTLEEVFQKIGHEEDEKEKEEAKAADKDKANDTDEDNKEEVADAADVSTELIAREAATFSQQLSAVFFMSSLKIRRNPMSTMFLVIAPLLFVIASAIVSFEHGERQL